MAGFGCSCVCDCACSIDCRVPIVCFGVGFDLVLVGRCKSWLLGCLFCCFWVVFFNYFRGLFCFCKFWGDLKHALDCFLE